METKIATFNIQHSTSNIQMNEVKKQFDLEERLLAFAVNILRIVDKMDKTAAGSHVGNQLMRAGTSPLFNQGEAQSAESYKDFVHKMKICLKELRETRRALRLIHRVPLTKFLSDIEGAIAESEELIRIFFTSIRTAKNNSLHEDSPQYGSTTESLSFI